MMDEDRDDRAVGNGYVRVVEDQYRACGEFLIHVRRRIL